MQRNCLTVGDKFIIIKIRYCKEVYVLETKRGLFIVIEGVDGSGKSTQADLLANYLRSLGRKVHHTMEPTESGLGGMVRDGLGGEHPRTSEELAAMFLALALVLPFLTGQIPQIGNALCPMHIPVLLCGFFCGPWYALAVGFISPLLRFLLFSMPPIMPKGISMSFELAAYGLFAGLLYKLLPKKNPYIYVSLIGAMLLGRVVWGIVRTVLYGLGKSEFGMALLVSEAFTNAIPGIILQIVLIPILVMALNRTGTKLNR